MTRLLLVGVIVAVLGATTAAQRQQVAPAGGIEVLPLRPNVHLVAGAGGNVAVQVGEDGVIVVDSGSAATAQEVLAAIARITPLPIRYVVNTSGDADHVGGNEVLSKAGVSILGTRVTGLASSASFFGSGPAPASILAMEQVLARMSEPDGRTPAYPAASRPTEIVDFGRRNLYLNGEGIEVVHQPAAHSDGDAIVFFRRSDVIVAGDIIDATGFPVIDVAKGGSIQGELDALNRLVTMAIPSIPIITREAGTLVVTGHGRVYDQFDVVAYRDMVTIIRDRVRDMMAAKRTLDQIKAAGPARGYAGRYGATTGPWTTNQFIEAIYRSLGAAKS